MVHAVTVQSPWHLLETGGKAVKAPAQHKNDTSAGKDSVSAAKHATWSCNADKVLQIYMHLRQKCPPSAAAKEHHNRLAAGVVD